MQMQQAYRSINCLVYLRFKPVYKSEGHRFEFCPVRLNPSTRFAARVGWVAGRGFCYVFIASFSGHQTNYHKSYHNNTCSTIDFS